MSGLEKSLFNLKFTSKQLNKQAMKAGKEMDAEKRKVKKAIQEGNNDIARLYSQNAIRKQSERLNLLKLASRIDAVSSRVQTAVTMGKLSNNMTTVVKGMDKAMQSMNTERISMVMDKFETQFDELDAAAEYYQSVSSDANAVATPQDEVDLLMQKVADEAGLELQQNLDANTPAKAAVESSNKESEEDKLNERLKALRA